MAWHMFQPETAGPVHPLTSKLNYPSQSGLVKHVYTCAANRFFHLFYLSQVGLIESMKKLYSLFSTLIHVLMLIFPPCWTRVTTLMSDSPHDCRPHLPLRSSVDFPGLDACCHHTADYDVEIAIMETETCSLVILLII